MEIKTDSEVVRKMMENLMQITSKFCKSDMRQKLKECQEIRIQPYHHLGSFVEGDKVWYQPLNGNSWLGPAAVLCQRGQSVWIHTHGDIKKVAACRVKPFQLVNRENKERTENEVKNLLEYETFEEIEDTGQENIGS